MPATAIQDIWMKELSIEDEHNEWTHTWEGGCYVQMWVVSPTLFIKVEVEHFISEMAHTHITLKYLVSMWCFSHLCVTLDPMWMLLVLTKHNITTHFMLRYIFIFFLLLNFMVYSLLTMVTLKETSLDGKFERPLITGQLTFTNMCHSHFWKVDTRVIIGAVTLGRFLSWSNDYSSLSDFGKGSTSSSDSDNVINFYSSF